uniref:Secreted protein n=1 Tax=Panagrellus redivivus TaxID=6233 RepID=A0A7E4ZTV5_PANRE
MRFGFVVLAVFAFVIAAFADDSVVAVEPADAAAPSQGSNQPLILPSDLPVFPTDGNSTDSSFFERFQSFFANIFGNPDIKNGTDNQ